MNNLEELLLMELGVPAFTVGKYLMKNNNTSLELIKTGCKKLKESDVYIGLALLVNKNIVSHRQFENTTIYFINTSLLKRRLYFPWYVHVISKSYDLVTTQNFQGILIKGIFKYKTHTSDIIDKLINDNIIIEIDEREEKSKFFKKNFLILRVNYSILDRLIIVDEICDYLTKKYNSLASDIYRNLVLNESLLSYSFYDNLNVLLKGENLPKKILIKHLEYLVNDGLAIAELDTYIPYKKVINVNLIKIHLTNLLLTSRYAKRMVNMIYKLGEVNDNDLRMKTLIPLDSQKLVILTLSELGITKQKINYPYRLSFRIVRSLFISFPYLSISISKKIENQLVENLTEINKFFKLENTLNINLDEYLNEIIGLAKDFMIFNFNKF
ncbi:hypothetical protein A0H76_1732 [Hepatospora eriocheir]|uniref:RNA polymerase III subunit C3 n=1 Tax=Hepatospora eriocheir TaxID=1081669 RepID=A0A1X0QKI1_9MICR|nr:hypothetical protein A0H76_1732 [Hepatospora eriocheir]